MPPWARVPRGLLAWTMVASLAGPAWGLGDVLIELFTAPTAGTGFAFGFYAVLLSLAAWILSYPEAINLHHVRPFIEGSLLFRTENWKKEDVFAGAEQRTIDAIYKEQTGKTLTFNPLRAVREHQTVEAARRELEDVRRQRQDQAGREDLASLQSGQPADITDVMRLFTMHRVPHRLIGTTFRVVVTPDDKVCHLHTLFAGFTPASVASSDARFRFHQEIVDLLQVFTGQAWLDRFRPYFDTVRLSGFAEVRDSFDLPQRVEQFRLTIAVTHLDARKGKIFIATELERLGTFEWIDASSNPSPAE